MRLQDYLNEENINSVVDSWIERIWVECQPFLKDVKNRNIFLWSGRSKNMDAFEGKVMKNRRPLDTPQELHDMIDEEFKKQLGITPRKNSLFCYTDSILTEAYGTPFMIFPIGEYRIVYSPKVRDMYGKLSSSSEMDLYSYIRYLKNSDSFHRAWLGLYDENKDRFNNSETQYIEWIKSGQAEREAKEKIKEVVKTYKITDMKGFKGKPVNEIMLICDKYIALNRKYKGTLKAKLF